MRAFNFEGSSSAAGAGSVSPVQGPLTASNEPQNVTVTPEINSLDVSWGPPVLGVNNAPTNYKVDWNPGGGIRCRNREFIHHPQPKCRNDVPGKSQGGEQCRRHVVWKRARGSGSGPPSDECDCGSIHDQRQWGNGECDDSQPGRNATDRLLLLLPYRYRKL